MTVFFPEICPERALVFRITHRRNIPFIARNGLHCSSSTVIDPQFVQIGSADLISKRERHPLPLPYVGVLGDYIPFYFTHSSMMLFNIITGKNVPRQSKEDIVFLVGSLRKFVSDAIPFVYTDRHAYLANPQFSNTLDDLNRIDWDILQRRDFQRNGNDPTKTSRYQAEALVHRHLPMHGLLGAACYTASVTEEVRHHFAAAGIPTRVATRSEWYF